MGRLAKNPPTVKNAGPATSGLLPGGTTATRPDTIAEGNIRYNTDNSAVEYWNGTNWSQVGSTGLVPVVKDSFAGDAVEVAFIMSRTVTTATDIIVVIGGVFQNPGVSFTTNGTTTITFTSAPPTGEAIIVLHGYNEVL